MQLKTGGVLVLRWVFNYSIRKRFFADKCVPAGASSQGGVSSKPKMKKFKIYRFSPQNGNKKPEMKEYQIDLNQTGGMILDALIKIKIEQDPTLTFRRSCREGVCGSCAMNVDGKNGLACLTKIKPGGMTKIYPLPHMYVIKDLVVDFSKFLQQHDRIKPYLIGPCNERTGGEMYLQSVKDRDMMDGFIECILCACCSTSCPEYWWHGHTKAPNDFLGPAALLNATRWLRDTRDKGFECRLDDLRNYYNVYRCHTINNCTTVCPKGLNPASAIAELRLYLTGKKKKYPDMTGTAAPCQESACPPRKSKKKKKKKKEDDDEDCD